MVPGASLHSEEEKNLSLRALNWLNKKAAQALKIDKLNKQIKSQLGGLFASCSNLEFSSDFQTEMCFVWSSSELAAEKI